MKKAQAALEFLMTYGWAILIFLAAMSTLMYMGVFDFNQFLVEKCAFPSSVYCVDGVIQNDEITLLLQNGMVIDMQNISVRIPECSENYATGANNLASGEEAYYTLACNITLEPYIKSKIVFNYTNPDSGLAHIKQGDLLFKIYRDE